MNLVKMVEKSNRAFSKMNKARKRVAIARDIIEALDKKILTATNGSYLRLDEICYSEKPMDNSVQNSIRIANKCNVCAKGAILSCWVSRKNKLNFGQLHFDSFSLSAILDNVFSVEQLMDIENAFEIWDKNHTIDYGIYNYDYIVLNSEDRLKMIMNHIIKNKGNFIIEEFRK